MPRVFIINDLNHDFDKAKRFGELVPVTKGKVPIFKTDATKALLKEGLHGFTADDYLLVSGPALLCMQALLVVSEIASSGLRGDTAIKVLIFDVKDQHYIVRHLYI